MALQSGQTNSCLERSTQLRPSKFSPSWALATIEEKYASQHEVCILCPHDETWTRARPQRCQAKSRKGSTASPASLDGRTSIQPPPESRSWSPRSDSATRSSVDGGTGSAETGCGKPPSESYASAKELSRRLTAISAPGASTSHRLASAWWCACLSKRLATTLDFCANATTPNGATSVPWRRQTIHSSKSCSASAASAGSSAANAACCRAMAFTALARALARRASILPAGLAASASGGAAAASSRCFGTEPRSSAQARPTAPRSQRTPSS
mmetsp:Transcript_32024/g.110703  ORF Transcript_32024/g.110703 Transcript_32024/m.110703 type:complete len:270 (-) Transcript_32024:684-1493(-)